MSSKRPPAGYRIHDTLLARKGGAAPLLRNEARLELVNDAPDGGSDAQRLTDAVLRTTAERLAAPKDHAKKPTAALTDLLDPSLVGVVSSHSGRVARVQARPTGSHGEAGKRGKTQ